MIDYKVNTFLVLCDTNSYRKTAERLNMTQPAVTHHIKQLEREYNCKLFIYKNRTLIKTREAKIIEKFARSASYNDNKLRKALVAKECLSFKIGATRTIGDYIIVDDIKRMLSNNEIELTVMVENTKRLLEALRKGSIDVAFIEGFIDREEFSYNVYRREELVCIVSAEEGLYKDEYQLAELLDKRLILREEGSGTREALQRVLDLSNMTVDSFGGKIEMNSFKLITELVAEGIGISFVYHSVAKNNNKIRQIKIKESALLHEFCCVYLKDTQPNSLLEKFLDSKM